MAQEFALYQIVKIKGSMILNMIGMFQYVERIVIKWISRIHILLISFDRIL